MAYRQMDRCGLSIALAYDLPNSLEVIPILDFPHRE